jgi:hypothetical protein
MYIVHVGTCCIGFLWTWGWILGRNWVIFLLEIYSHLYTNGFHFCWGEGGLKLVGNLNIVYRNLKSENSQDCLETSTKLYVHEFGLCTTYNYLFKRNTTSNGGNSCKYIFSCTVCFHIILFGFCTFILRTSSFVHFLLQPQSTQSGIGHFLVYIPSRWKNSPVWWWWGVQDHPLTLYLPSRTTLWCTLQLERAETLPYFYSTPIHCKRKVSNFLVPDKLFPARESLVSDEDGKTGCLFYCVCTLELQHRVPAEFTRH